ncbi:unnamed protein product, partial [marine sediment metagenome]
ADSANAAVIANTAGVTSIAIRDLKIDGNGTNQSGNDQHHAMFIVTATDVSVSGLEITNTDGDGVYLRLGCSRVRITDNYVHDVDRIGFHIPASNNLVVSGNTLVNCGQTAIKSEPDATETADADNIST